MGSSLVALRTLATEDIKGLIVSIYLEDHWAHKEGLLPFELNQLEGGGTRA